MTYAQYAAAVAAVCVLLWPRIKAVAGSLESWARLPVVPGPRRPAHSFEESISSLASVRERLIATDALSPEAKGAIDVLTLALVAGSDK